MRQCSLGTGLDGVFVLFLRGWWKARVRVSRIRVTSDRFLAYVHDSVSIGGKNKSNAARVCGWVWSNDVVIAFNDAVTESNVNASEGVARGVAAISDRQSLDMRDMSLEYMSTQVPIIRESGSRSRDGPRPLN